VRHLHLPFCDVRTLAPALQQPEEGTQPATNTFNFYLDEAEAEGAPPEGDEPAVDIEREEQPVSNAKELENVSAYDKALSECIDLFERLESLNVSFCDWTMPTGTDMNIAVGLLRARLQPLLPSTITSSITHFNTITRLSFSGIRSQTDQAEVVRCLEEYPRLHSNLQKLTVIYRFDYLLFSVGSELHDPPIDNALDSKPLWTAIGKMEKLESLTIAYMPQRESEADMTWQPKVFKPKLKRIYLEEVLLTQGVVRSILANRQGLKALVAGPSLIYGIRELQATSEQPVTFPQLSTLELSLTRGADAFDALAVFTHAPVTQLAITISEPLPFLQQYPEHKARQKTVEVLALHEIYGDEEGEHRLSEAQKEEWIQKYKDLGIKLCIQ
jgi:hypothetical protein